MYVYIYMYYTNNIHTNVYFPQNKLTMTQIQDVRNRSPLKIHHDWQRSVAKG